MKKAHKAIFALAILLLHPIAQADQVLSMNLLFGGHNIYGPNVLYDHQAGVYKMWYMGWATSGQTQDYIYYRTSGNGADWSPALISLTPGHLNGKPGVDVQVKHTGDPSVTKHYNAHNGTYQYTMFLTVCKNNCTETLASNDNEIWSMVSTDGVNWLYPKVLLRSAKGPAEPHAIVDPNGDTFWKVYYADRLDSSKIKMAKVSGNRDVLSIQTVYTNPAHLGAVSGPEVHNINGSWRIFFNTHNGSDALHGDPSRADYRVDILEARSASNELWPSSPNGLVLNGIQPGTGCATSTPGVVSHGASYELFFGYANRRADGVCENTRHNSIHKWLLLGQ